MEIIISITLSRFFLEKIESQFSFYAIPKQVIIMGDNNSTTVNIEPWFISFDSLLCASFTIILAVVFISIIVLDKNISCGSDDVNR